MFKGIFDYCNFVGGGALLAFGEWKSGMVLGASHRAAPKKESSGSKASSAEVRRPQPQECSRHWFLQVGPFQKLLERMQADLPSSSLSRCDHSHSGDGLCSSEHWSGFL